MRVLVAEDDNDLAEVMAFGARMNWPGCEVVVAPDGAQALAAFEQGGADLVVLDINMPVYDGFEVCQEIRRVSQVPILMLTARTATIDKIRALDLGADDYIVKPFDHLELLARLRALVRRAGSLRPDAANGQSSANESQSDGDSANGSGAQGVPSERPADSIVRLGDLTVDANRREVTQRGEIVPLTSTEYRLLEELVRSPGEVLPHATLIERVWGPEYAGEDHYLKVFVRRLRRKLGDDANQPRYIQTEWGIGYRFVPQQ